MIPLQNSLHSIQPDVARKKNTTEWESFHAGRKGQRASEQRGRVPQGSR